MFWHLMRDFLVSPVLCSTYLLCPGCGHCPCLSGAHRLLSDCVSFQGADSPVLCCGFVKRLAVLLFFFLFSSLSVVKVFFLDLFLDLMKVWFHQIHRSWVLPVVHLLSLTTWRLLDDFWVWSEGGSIKPWIWPSFKKSHFFSQHLLKHKLNKRGGTCTSVHCVEE